MATPPPRTPVAEETFDDVANRPASEERPASRILPTHFPSLAKLEDTMRAQITSILVLVEDAVVRLFEEEAQAMESGPDAKLIFIIQTVVNRALTKRFQDAVFYSPVQEAVNNCVAEPQTADAVVTKMVYIIVSAVPVSKFIKHEVKNGSLAKAIMEERFNLCAETVDEKTIKIEDGIPSKITSSIQSSNPPTDISDDKETIPVTNSTATSSDGSESSLYNVRHRERRKRRFLTFFHHRFVMLRSISEHLPSPVQKS